MWVVRFIRKDGKPDEEYFYPTFSDAEYHRRVFGKIEIEQKGSRM